MAMVSEKLGQKWEAAKISGYWLIYRDGELLCGRQELGQKAYKSFTKVLADCTGWAVVSTVPFK